MERFLFLLLAVLLCGCESHDESQPQLDELDEKLANYHFYYVSASGEKCDLKLVAEEYCLIVKTTEVDNVLQRLNVGNLQIVSGPSSKNFSWSDDYIVPEMLEDCSHLCVKGDINLRNLEDVIYWGHVYRAESRNEIMKGNTFWVKCNGDETQINQLLKYAAQHNVIPLGLVSNVMELACTIYSSGNPVEVANWIMETGEFELAQPNLYAPISIDKDIL